MTDNELGLIGLGIRAGSVSVGVSSVRAGLQRGDIALVVLAADRSERTLDKVERLAVQRGIEVQQGPPAAVLGSRFGFGEVQALGIRDAQLAAGLRNAHNGTR